MAAGLSEKAVFTASQTVSSSVAVRTCHHGPASAADCCRIPWSRGVSAAG
jgi:hypothetical protein